MTQTTFHHNDDPWLEIRPGDEAASIYQQCCCEECLYFLENYQLKNYVRQDSPVPALAVAEAAPTCADDITLSGLFGLVALFVCLSLWIGSLVGGVYFAAEILRRLMCY